MSFDAHDKVVTLEARAMKHLRHIIAAALAVTALSCVTTPPPEPSPGAMLDGPVTIPHLAGEERVFAGIVMVWVPPGTFMMGRLREAHKWRWSTTRNTRTRMGLQPPRLLHVFAIIRPLLCRSAPRVSHGILRRLVC